MRSNLSQNTSKIAENLNLKRDDYFSILPIFTMFSIILYYRYDVKISPISSSLIAVISIISSRNYKKYIKIPALILFFLVCGFLACELRESYAKVKTINKKVKDLDICGKVLQISIGNIDNVILIDKILSDSKLPKKIRFKIQKEQYNPISPSDKVCFKADIFPLPKPIYPNAYNFSEVARYQKIGALGRIKSEIKIILQEKVPGFDSFFEKIRLKIDKMFIKTMGESNEAGVAMALFTANKGYISNDVLQDVKKSGLSHLLAISGIHISVIAITSFMIIRRLLVFNEKLATCYDIKKIAAIFAILISFFHLQISSAPLSAVRSFVMFSFGILGILSDRRPSPNRFLSFAFFLIIMQKPESIFNPSLQMSFMAVMSLISGFLLISQKIENRFFDAGKFLRFWLYLFAIFFSSVVATFSTMFFTIYHFNQFSISGLLANIIAVPVVEFLSIPLGVIAFLLSFVGLEYPALKLMQLANYIFLQTAHYFASFKYSYLVVHEMPTRALFFYTISLIFLFLLRSKLRYILFLAFFSIALALHINFQLPNVVIGRGAEDFIFKNHDETYVSREEIKNSFVNNLYSGKLGQREILQADKLLLDERFTKFEKYDVFDDGKILIYIINREILENECAIFIKQPNKKTFILDRENYFKNTCKNFKYENQAAKRIENWKILRFGAVRFWY